MSTKLPVSVYFVSGAEAHRIGRALEAVSGWAGEIVVVLNSEVQDGTEEIALSHGAKVFREPWKGFVGQKNSAVAKTSHPWILNLDADEIVTPSLAAEISGVVTQEQASPDVYEFPRCTLYCGKWIRHGDWYPDRVRRLSRREKTIWAGEEPHASLQIQGNVGRLKSDLLHNTSESIAKQIAKIAPYHQDFVRRGLAAGREPGFFSLVVRPWWKFLRGYIFRLGFLDGWQGYYIARFSAFSTLTRQAMTCEAQLPLEEPPCPPQKSR